MPGAARPFLLCALAVAVLTVLAGLSDATAFARVLGPVPPLAAVVSATLAGAAALALIQRRNWFAARPRTGSVRAAFIGAVFAVPTVALDLAWPFDPGLNVSMPAAAG